jgi:hypothetical protein
VPTIAVDAVSFQSVTVSARAIEGASVAQSAATATNMPIPRVRIGVRVLCMIPPLVESASGRAEGRVKRSAAGGG